MTLRPYFIWIARAAIVLPVAIALGQIRPPAPKVQPAVPVQAAPTGPATPAFVATSPWPMTVRMTWSHFFVQLGKVSSFVLLRADAPNAPFQKLAVQPNLYQEYYDDILPDPRNVYRYRLVANYTDGTVGYADAQLTSAPLLNPTGFRAVLTPPSTVTLQWDLMLGAKSYRIDGTGVTPNTVVPGSVHSFTVQNVPAGAHSWQIVALYTGNFADYQHPAVAALMNHSLPPHSPSWLTKNNGPGNAALAARHYSSTNPFAFAFNIGDNPPGVPRIPGFPTAPSYKNVTELGLERVAGCNSVAGSPPSMVCWAETRPVQFSVIAINSQGAKFATFAELPYIESQGGFDGWDWPIQYGATGSTVYDSEGAKYAPHVCLPCHGGHYDATSGVVQGATLLPIDPSLVQVEGDRATALRQIQQINTLILASNPALPVAEYIRELNASPATWQSGAPFVPQGWSQEANLYLSVIKPYCAMCHLATPAINFLSAGDLTKYKTQIYQAVCVVRSMPHAELPYTNFYTAGGAVSFPGLLAARLGYPSCP